MKSVFVLDDDPDQADLMVLALGGSERQVHGFSDPLRAIYALQQNRPDLLVADLSLSWLDGKDLIKSVRQWHPDLAMILVSGYSRGAEIAEAAGIPFFLKPVDLNVLKKAVDEALTRVA
jgi:DNA-binding NtrC family response regulator